MIKEMMKKYSVLICLFIAAIFIVIATFKYPGGSMFDKNSIGFDWTKNFMSNLFQSIAMNGSENLARIWAVIGMVFYSVGHGLFFINMSKKFTSKPLVTIFKIIGASNILLIFLIATPLHDIGVLSIFITLIGLFIITVFVLKSKLHVLKVFCIVCLLTYYCFFFFFGMGYLNQAVVMQKVYIICSMLLVLVLEHFTKLEDFKAIQSSEKESK